MSDIASCRDRAMQVIHLAEVRWASWFFWFTDKWDAYKNDVVKQ
jgi:hypothetical protein